MKTDKGNGVVILDRKLYNKAIQEDPALRREASLQRFFT